MFRTNKEHFVTMKRLTCVVAAMAALSLVAACGNDSSGGGGAGNGEVSAAAQTIVDKQLAAPTNVGVDVALSKKPPTGLIFVEVAPADALGAVRTQAEKEAAEALGWTFKNITPGPGPEDVQKAVQSALQMNPLPFAITVSGIGKEAYLPQLAEAKEKGVHIISNSTLDEGGSGDGIVATVNQAKNSLIEPQQIAAWIAVDSGGEANVLALDLPAYPIVHNALQEFEKSLKEYCSGCDATIVPVQAGDIGTAVPQNVVSQIQKNPKIDYIFTLGPVTTGVNAALTGAGLTDGAVKIVGMGPNPENLQGLRDKDGFNYAWSAFSAPVSGWQTVDIAARLSVRDPIDVVSKQVSPTQILTQDTVGDLVEDGSGNYIGVGDYQEQFKAMWLVN